MARTRVDAARKPHPHEYFVRAERDGSGHYRLLKAGEADKPPRTVGIIYQEHEAIAAARFFNAGRLLIDRPTDDLPF